jgi:iron(III) transport system substrate-binding protein
MIKNIFKLAPYALRKAFTLFVIFSFLAFFSSCNDDQNTSSNQPETDQPVTKGQVTFYTVRYGTMEDQLIKTFEQRKRIKVNVVTGTADELLDRLNKEGANTSADVVLFDNLIDMFAAKKAGVLQPFSTDSVAHSMPSRNTDAEGYWAGMSKWAMGYGCNKVAIPKPSVINLYKDIVGPYWKGRVVISKADNKENQFLVATMIAEQGEAATRTWLNKLITTLSIDPVENTEEVIRAVAEGKGDLSLVNASEHIRWTNSGVPENFETGEKVGVKVPYDSNIKSYYNLVSIGLTRNTPNRGFALTFIDYLISQSAQQYYCDLTFEYPVNVFTMPSDFILNVGGFAEKELNFSKAAENIELAKKMMKEAGWK